MSLGVATLHKKMAKSSVERVGRDLETVATGALQFVSCKSPCEQRKRRAATRSMILPSSLWSH